MNQRRRHPGLCPTRPRRRSALVPSREVDEQRALFQWAALVSPALPVLRLLYAIPNGGHRDKRTAAILKGQGVKAGMPDVCLPVPRGGYAACYLELKIPGGRVSPNQQRMHVALRDAGNYVATVIGWDEARYALEGYLRGWYVHTE